MAGGGGERNWSPVSSANARTSGQFVKTGCLKFGGVSWYSPGPDCGTNTDGVLSEPSFARSVVDIARHGKAVERGRREEQTSVVLETIFSLRDGCRCPANHYRQCTTSAGRIPIGWLKRSASSRSYGQRCGGQLVTARTLVRGVAHGIVLEERPLPAGLGAGVSWTRDHGVQPNVSHSFVAGGIVGSVMLAVSLSAGLTTRSRPVMQPAAPRRTRSTIAVATRVAECGGICFCVMLDLRLLITLGIMPCRAFTS